MGCPERHETKCAPEDLDPKIEGGITIVDERRPCILPRLERESDYWRSEYCKESRIKACSVTMEGPPGGHALVCRDAQGAITGPVRFVAPDGSIVVEGVCERHLPTGAWLWWRYGRIENVLGYSAGSPTGIIINHRDGRYWSWSTKSP